MSYPDFVIGVVAAALAGLLLLFSGGADQKKRLPEKSCAESVISELVTQQTTLKNLKRDARRARSMAEELADEGSDDGR